MSDSEREQSTSNRQEDSREEASSAAIDAFSLFRGYLDTKLDTFKRELSVEQQETAENSIKRIKTNDSSKVKNKGNRIQFEFNQSIEDKVSSLDKAIVKKDLKKCSEISEDIKVLLKKRNKLIRLADKSTAGWRFADEYGSDELASDSEDDKKIRRAESRAMRAITTEKKKKSAMSSGRFQRPGNGSYDSHRMDRSDRQQPFRQQPSRFGGGYTSYERRTTGAKDICFNCGKTGHWKQDCPENRNKNTQ